jgi:opacity protein-like surface antigen
MRTTVMSVMACALLSAAAMADEPSVAAADAQPDGTVRLSGGSVAVGVGYVWGHAPRWDRKAIRPYIHSAPRQAASIAWPRGVRFPSLGASGAKLLGLFRPFARRRA